MRNRDAAYKMYKCIGLCISNGKFSLWIMKINRYNPKFQLSITKFEMVCNMKSNAMVSLIGLCQCDSETCSCMNSRHTNVTSPMNKFVLKWIRIAILVGFVSAFFSTDKMCVRQRLHIITVHALSHHKNDIGFLASHACIERNRTEPNTKKKKMKEEKSCILTVISL